MPPLRCTPRRILLLAALCVVFTTAQSSTSTRTPTRSPTRTGTASPARTRTSTGSATHSRTRSPTRSAITPSHTDSPTKKGKGGSQLPFSPSPSGSPLSTRTPSGSASAISPSDSPLSTRTPSGSASATASASASASGTPSLSPTRSAAASRSGAATRTRSRTGSVSGSGSSSTSASPSSSSSGSATGSPASTGSVTRSGSKTPKPSISLSASRSGTRTGTDALTPSFTLPRSATGTPSTSSSNTQTATVSSTNSPSSSNSASGSPSLSAHPSRSSSRSMTGTRSGTATPVPTHSSTGSPSPSDTATLSASVMSSSSATPSPTPSKTPTLSNTSTLSVTASLSRSVPPSAASTASNTGTPTISSTSTHSASCSPTPSGTGPSTSLTGTWLSYLLTAADPFQAVVGSYTYSFTPFVSVLQGSTVAGGVYAGTTVTADATCISGERYVAQFFTGGATAGACVTPGGAREASVTLSCSSDGSTSLSTVVTESPVCFYTLGFSLPCNIYNTAQPGTLCVAPTGTSTPSSTGTSTSTPSPSSSLSIGALPSVSPTTSNSVSSTPSPSPSRFPPVDWTTHGLTKSRSFVNTAEAYLSPATVPDLRLLWRTTITGASVGQPLFLSNVLIGGVVIDLVFAGTESGYVYAINGFNGSLVWTRSLGAAVTTCGDLPYDTFGIGGTPVIDRPAGLIYAASNGALHAMSITTGAEATGAWPIANIYDPSLLHNYGALNLYGGLVYITLAGLCDNGNYAGGVVAVNVSTASVVATFKTVPTGIYGGGVWGGGGVVVAPGVANGPNSLWTAAGNTKGAATEWSYYGEHAIQLTPASLTVLSSFSPNALVDFIGDGDMGATPGVFAPSASSGCADVLVTVQHKAGVMYVLSGRNLSTMYGSYQLAASTSNGQFITTSTYDALSNTLYVVSPSDAPATSASATMHPNVAHGVQAFHIMSDCSLSLTWNSTLGLPWNAGDLSNNAPYTSPTLANGVVYIGGGLNKMVLAADAHSGALLWSATTANAVFAPPVVASGRVIVADWGWAANAVYMYAAP